MPYADPAYQIKWRETNRDFHKSEDQRKKQKLSRIKKRKETMKNLPDKYVYDNSNNKKSKMKYCWRKKGLRLCELERTWDRYINTENCDICNISFKKVKKNMEHSHETGYMRFIACQRCNTFLRYRDQYFKDVLKGVHQSK